MQIEIEPGKYIVAVSGGVDSMVLLDMLRQKPGLDLIVAHFEHGIREDSDEDLKLVEKTAATYGLPFVYERGHLGHDASESEAREARYAFLRRVKKEQGARAIITAHHQDDLLETAMINLLRGTGRKGLASLRSTGDLARPLLHVTKMEVLGYAAANGVAWHEDATNLSDEYLRNYIRHNLVPRLGAEGKDQLLAHIEKAEELNPDIDSLLLHGLHAQTSAGELHRQWFIMLPYVVSCEVMAAWLRQHSVRGFDKKTIGRLVVAAKVAAAGKESDVNAVYLLKVGKTMLQLKHR